MKNDSKKNGPKKNAEREDLDSDDGHENGGRLHELLKSAVSGSLSALFMTEESVRRLIKERKLPTEWSADLISLAGKQKDFIMSLVAKEVSSFFQKLDFQKEVSQFFQDHSVKFNAEISFEPKNKSKERH